MGLRSSGVLHIEQVKRKRQKLLVGMVRTYLRGRVRPATDRTWDDWWSAGVSDIESINPNFPALAARHHYTSVELLITRHLHSLGRDLEGAAVLDIGSGGGHWVDFYRSLGAGRVVATDLAKASAEHLEERFADDGGVEVLHGSAEDVLIGQDVDVVNAIGVMFHIVDDERWRRALSAARQALRPGGLLIVGGHFGWLPPVNVQFSSDGTVTKRLRPRRMWERELHTAGFSSVRVHRNPAYAFVSEDQPENHVLVAQL